MTKMKSLARLHIWWPGIDEKIEQFVKTCTSCSQNAQNPIKVSLHQWKIPAQLWQRIHVDFAGIKCGSWLWMHLASGLKSTHYGHNNR